MLRGIANSRTEAHCRVTRAEILLGFADGKSVSQMARELHLSRPTVERCIDKALDLGLQAALEDLPRSGRPPRISSEAKGGCPDHRGISRSAPPLDFSCVCCLARGGVENLALKTHPQER